MQAARGPGAPDLSSCDAVSIVSVERSVKSTLAVGEWLWLRALLPILNAPELPGRGCPCKHKFEKSHVPQNAGLCNCFATVESAAGGQQARWSVRSPRKAPRSAHVLCGTSG